MGTWDGFDFEVLVRAIHSTKLNAIYEEEIHDFRIICTRCILHLCVTAYELQLGFGNDRNVHCMKPYVWCY